MTRSPGDDTPKVSNDPIRMPSFLDDDETQIAQASRASTSLASLDLPGYEFIREIHRGGQGVVYLALQKSTHRKVAIKVMKEGPFAGPDDRARFDREVRILARLKHPNIVTIHDSGRAAGCDYFIMDYVEGESLADFLTRKHPMGELVELFRRICEAVQSAHDHGIVHRDLKPSNIRIDSAGEPHILDFGLAKTPGSTLEPSHVTQSGFFVGSIPWASPEQADGHVAHIDSRADVYSLGVIFYFMLTNRFPYDITGSPAEVLSRVAHVDPIRPRSISREIDSELDTILLKCLQKEPDRRYANAGQLAADLAAYESGSPISARRDSSIYLARKLARKWLRSNRALAYVAITLLVSLLVITTAAPLIYSNAIDRQFRRVAIRFAPPVTTQPAMEYVRVVLLTERTDVRAVAAHENLRGINQGVPKSLRRLHGRLMERLAVARPRTVVFDISFRDASEFDVDMVAGVLALRDGASAVTVAVRSWDLNENGLPELSPVLVEHVRWGSLVCDCPANSAWAVEPVMYRPGYEPRPSLALTAYAAYRQPMAQLSLAIDASEQHVQLNYWQSGNNAANTRRWLKECDTVRLTSLQKQKVVSEKGDLRPGDILGVFGIAIPSQSVLDASTVEYADIFSASSARLREWFEGRAVIIGNGQTDRIPYFDGRSVPGVYSHAVALESMLASKTIRLPRNLALTGITIIGGILGVSIGIVLGRPHRSVHRTIALFCLTFLLLATATLGMSLVVFRTTWYLINPLVPLVAAWAAAGLAILARRVGAPRTEFRSAGGVLSA